MFFAQQASVKTTNQMIFKWEFLALHWSKLSPHISSNFSFVFTDNPQFLCNSCVAQRLIKLRWTSSWWNPEQT
jgi:hypothetical protein